MHALWFEIERPRRHTLSPPSSSSSSSSSNTLTTNMYSPPPLTWHNAAQDARAGICYTKDAFPSSSFLPPPFSREPVSVEPADRIQLLQELDGGFAVRVRVLRTGQVGLIPAWNTEGALERLTRLNTAFNEAATCPVEARALRRRDSSSSSSAEDAPAPPSPCAITHVHARCIPYATRVRFPDYYGPSSTHPSEPDSDLDSDSSDADSPVSPSPQLSFEAERGRPLSHPAVFEAPSQNANAGPAEGGLSAARARAGTGRRKSVNFAALGERPQVVFRYLPEHLVGAVPDDAEAHSSAEDGAEDGSDWWWQGWEETCADAHDDDGEQGVDGAPSEDLNIKRGAPTINFDDIFPFMFAEAELAY